MLDKKDKIVMNYIFEKIESESSKLISMEELIKQLQIRKYIVTTRELGEIMIGLSKEGLIDFVESESKKGEMFCVSLKPKGKLFKKDMQKEKRYFSWIILRTILLTIFSFVIGLILKAIF